MESTGSQRPQTGPKPVGEVATTLTRTASREGLTVVEHPVVATLRRQRDALRQQRDAARRREETIRTHNGALRRQLQALRRREEAVRTENAALRDQREVLRRREEALRSENEGLRRQREVLRRQREELRGQADVLRGREQALRRAVDALRRQRRALRDQQDVMAGRVAVLRRSRDETRTAARVARSRATVLARRLTVLRSANDALTSLRRVVLDELVVDPPRNRSVDPATAERREVRSRIRRLSAEARLVADVARGRGVDEAALTTVRSLLDIGQHVRARSFALSLVEGSETATVGHIGLALVALHQTLRDLALHHLRAVPEEDLARHCPVEWLDVEFSLDSDRARHLLEADERLMADDTTVFSAARFAYREGRRDIGSALLHRLDRARSGAPALNGRDADDFRWLLRWEAQERVAPAAQEGATTTIGILDYKQPDFLRQSSNLGDYVQTVASLGHLLAHRDVSLTGDPLLVQVLEELRGRVRPDLVRDEEVERPVRVVAVNRDATRYDAVPADTWLVAFGWYMHTTFGGSYDFPFHPNIRPIFVSFHVQRRAMLTDEAVAYLKQHGPVGCRDWTTVYLLLGLGIDAFFSGCLTATVDAFFPQHGGPPANERTAVVDLEVPDDLAGAPGVVEITQVGSDISRASLTDNLRDALTLLEEYRGFSRIVTSRLHCYLPATAIGCDVDFRPKRLSDVRFDGLLGIRPGSAELVAMQVGLREKLGALYRSILSGARVDEVYATWSALTADAVAEARARLAAPVASLSPTFDEVAACQRVRAGGYEVDHGGGDAYRGDVVHVALAADANLREQMAVVVESIVGHTSRPLHFWVLARGHDHADFAELARLFPEAAFTFLPCDHVDYGSVTGMLKHTTVSTMDRLLLPLLLGDVPRVLYHDIDAVSLTDVGPLFDTDLQGRPVAARSARASWAESGFGNVYRVAGRLEHSVAFELRRRMHQALPYDFLSFNAGIMVLDLDRMRRDDFCRRFIPFAEQFGMNDQEILNCYVGTDRVVLDPAWNAVPHQEVVRDPKILHWAGPAKPWNREYVAHQEEWDRHADLLRARRARAEAPAPAPR